MKGGWKQTGRPGKDKSVAAAKLLRCLQMIDLLKLRSWSIGELSERFNISERTAYRYIHLFEECSLLIEQDFDNKFYIQKQ